jgi:hypothetical protein
MLGEKEEKYIAKLTKLIGLCIGGITNSNIRMLNNLVNLENINIYDSTFTTLDELRYCINLETLHITTNAQLTDIQALKEFPRLKKVAFNSCSGIISSLAVLRECPKLTDAVFNKCGITSLIPFKECFNLQCLQIDEKVITREELLTCNEEVFTVESS